MELCYLFPDPDRDMGFWTLCQMLFFACCLFSVQTKTGNAWIASFRNANFILFPRGRKVLQKNASKPTNFWTWDKPRIKVFAESRSIASICIHKVAFFRIFYTFFCKQQKKKPGMYHVIAIATVFCNPKHSRQGRKEPTLEFVEDIMKWNVLSHCHALRNGPIIFLAKILKLEKFAKTYMGTMRTIKRIIMAEYLRCLSAIANCIQNCWEEKSYSMAYAFWSGTLSAS